MNTLFKILSIGAVGATLYFGSRFANKIYVTQTSGNALKSDIIKIKWRGFSSGNLNIDIIFQHTNPTDNTLVFNYMFLDIFFGTQQIAQVREENINFNIPPNRVTEQSVRVKASSKKIGMQLLSLLWSGNLPKEALIKGQIKVNDFITQYNKSYPIS